MCLLINSFDGKFAFLSNFFNSPIPISDGIDTFTAKTMEHFFQASKTPNIEEFLDILAADTPGKAKRLGRKCMLYPDWEKIKINVMESGLYLKFSDPILKTKLLETGNEILEEGNYWHDNFWGNCYCDRCKNITGQNNLGKLLMKLRAEFMEEN